MERESPFNIQHSTFAVSRAGGMIAQGTVGPMIARLSGRQAILPVDRKSTRLNSSHSQISYAAFCLKKKNRAAPGRARQRVLLQVLGIRSTQEGDRAEQRPRREDHVDLLEARSHATSRARAPCPPDP